MDPFNEVKETKENIACETDNKTKAFENVKNEEIEIRHIPTINEGLKGEKNQETNVEYKSHKFKLDGETVEGVFPKFPDVYNTQLPKDLWKSSDVEQFKYCTNNLKQKMETDPEFRNKFTPRQIEQINSGAPRISGLTWHHNEVPGKMQLVDAETHEKCRHTGGRSIWGGGAENR